MLFILSDFDVLVTHLQFTDGKWNDAVAVELFSKNQQGVWVDIAKKAFSFCKERVQSRTKLSNKYSTYLSYHISAMLHRKTPHKERISLQRHKMQRRRLPRYPMHAARVNSGIFE